MSAWTPRIPYATEQLVDRTAAVSVDGAGCMEGDRFPEFADFLIDGRTAAEEELRLKSETSRADLGNGPGKVPGAVDSATGALVPVSGIPFPANGPEEFRYSRSCLAEHGDVPAPDGFEGPARFSGRVEHFGSMEFRVGGGEAAPTRNSIEPQI